MLTAFLVAVALFNVAVIAFCVRHGARRTPLALARQAEERAIVTARLTLGVYNTAQTA